MQIGGRGKAGGIKLANNRAEAEEHARAILGMDIRGLTVYELWIEGCVRDRLGVLRVGRSSTAGAKAPLVMLSTKGGMDIEAVAEEDPDAIARLHVDPLLGFQDFHGRPPGVRGRRRCRRRAPGRRDARQALRRVRTAEEATLVEVNPLIVTPEREVKALDAKVTLDGNALFRHPGERGAARPVRARTRRSRWPRSAGLTYVKLDGNIGILGNGAGLVMSTLDDVIKLAGGEPANFLDAADEGKADAITKRRRGDPLKREGQGGAVQHLRRDHRCDEVAGG